MVNGSANSNGEKKALIIAISDYDNSSGLKSIQFCKNDGEEMYNVLINQGYNIPENRKLIGYVDSQKLKNAIYDFFTNEDNKPDDTLVFYYSGHGIPDKWGATFLAPSNIVSDHPFMAGFSFDDLTNSMLTCNSLRIVTLLDSCFSGSLKISKGLDSKGGEEAAARIANNLVETKSDKLKQGVGRCLLAASQGYEEAFERQEKDHSIFTYYLIEGIKGHKNAVDDEGNVTYDSLGKFISRGIGNLPPEKRPKQTPIRKGEVSGEDIILAKYPHLKKTKESDYYALYGKGQEYYLAGKYDKALECYDSILKIQPNNENALLRKGMILTKRYDDKTALEYFDQVIKLNDNNSDAWYYKAQLSIMTGNYEQAVRYLDRASSIDPDDERVWDGYKKAKSLMKTSIKEAELLSEIRSQTSKQNYSGVISLSDQAIKLDPKNHLSYFYKGQALEQLKKYDDAIKYYDIIIQMKPDYVEAYYRKGRALFSLKYYEQAIDSFDNALKIQPKYIDAAEARGLAHEMQIQREISQIIEDAETYSKKRDYENALKLLDKGINFNQNDQNLYKFKGRLLVKMGKYEDGIKCYDKALGIYREDTDTLIEKGLALIMMSKHPEAVTVFDKALRLEPGNTNTLYQKGVALYNSEEYEEAIQCFDAALKIRPTYFEAKVAKDQAESKIGGALKIQPAVTEEATLKDAAESKENMIDILFLSADPFNIPPLELIKECNAIRDELLYSAVFDKFKFTQRHDIPLDDLPRQILLRRPQIIHFSGHGSPRSALVFKGQNLKLEIVPPEVLSNIFDMLDTDISLVFLDSCYSEEQANAISKHVKFVIGISGAISDKATTKFAASFYSCLAFGKSVEDSFKLAKVDLELLTVDIPEEAMPVLLVKESSSSESN